MAVERGHPFLGNAATGNRKLHLAGNLMIETQLIVCSKPITPHNKPAP